MKLNIAAFAVTCSLIWGLGLLGLTWWIILFEGSSGQQTFIGLVYRGYNISPLGSVIGMLWGLGDGLMGGAVFAWLYNLIATQTCAAKQQPSDESPGEEQPTS